MKRDSQIRSRMATFGRSSFSSQIRKKEIFFAAIFIFLISLISGEIIIPQQPNGLYNLGDVISIPVIVKSMTDFTGIFEMDLICNGIQNNFYRNGLFLSPGQEKNIDAAVILNTQTLGNTSGFCRIKSILGNEFVLTNEFKISDKINIQLLTEKTDFSPQETIVIEGKATKENGIQANGFIDLIFVPENTEQNTTYQNTINNGFFSVSFVLPKETKAGNYLLKINAYEKDSFGILTNKGYSDYNIRVAQVPTSLEIVFEEKKVEPGTPLAIKAILHDQTGEKISSSAIISLKDSFGKLREQIEKPTDDFWNVHVEYNEPPSEWTVVAISEGITSEMNFEITEKEKAEIKIINNTLLVTNKGNVPYNESLLVKIGHDNVNLDVSLAVDETKKYTLTAPDGEYYIEIIGNGETQDSESVLLTGKSVSVKQSSAVLTLTRYPLAWIFVILVLGFILAMILKKGYRKSFVGYMTPEKKETIRGRETSFFRKKGLTLRSKNKAEVSVSLKGEKQPASFVLLKIKNPDEIKGSEAVEQTIQEVINFAEENKAIAYLSTEGFNNILFIIAPIITRTFKNEKSAIEIAKQFNEILEKYNKLAKQKIDFGISLNSGDIIIKREAKTFFKFATFGNLMNTLKKIAAISDGLVLLGEEIKNKIISEMGVEKHIKEGLNVYTLKEPRFKGDSTKFINEFVKRLGKDNKSY